MDLLEAVDRIHNASETDPSPSGGGVFLIPGGVVVTMRTMMRKTASLYLTHTPDAYRVGDIHEGPGTSGERYRITRIKKVAPTALLAGGTVPCFEVYGKRVPGLVKWYCEAHDSLGGPIHCDIETLHHNHPDLTPCEMKQRVLV